MSSSKRANDSTAPFAIPFSRGSRGLACAALAIACFLTGCQSTSFNAATLPPEYAAANRANRGVVDLSRLAGNSVTNDMIYPGDVIDITIATGAEIEPPQPVSLRVSRDGNVSVPEVGPVQVAGLTLVAAEERIRGESIGRGYYRNPSVTVQLASRYTYRVTVSGEVNEPGVYEIPAGQSDLLAAIVAAGGLTEDAGDFVEVKHPVASPPGNVRQASFQGQQPPQFQAMRVDLTQASVANRQDFSLFDGSRVMVIRRPPETIQVIGLVKQPGQFEHPSDQDLRLLDAIALAGGRTLSIADKVKIVRTAPGSESSVVISASINEAKLGGKANLRLQPGDVVSVEETPTTFTVQTLKDFIRFGFTSALPGF